MALLPLVSGFTLISSDLGSDGSQVQVQPANQPVQGSKLFAWFPILALNKSSLLCHFGHCTPLLLSDAETFVLMAFSPFDKSSSVWHLINIWKNHGLIQEYEVKLVLKLGGSSRLLWVTNSN